VSAVLLLLCALLAGCLKISDVTCESGAVGSTLVSRVSIKFENPSKLEDEHKGSAADRKKARKKNADNTNTGYMKSVPIKMFARGTGTPNGGVDKLVRVHFHRFASTSRVEVTLRPGESKTLTIDVSDKLNAQGLGNARTIEAWQDVPKGDDKNLGKWGPISNSCPSSMGSVKN
jgi:hypothetical protein